MLIIGQNDHLQANLHIRMFLTPQFTESLMKATLRLVNIHQKANKCLKAFSSVILCQDLLTEEWAHRMLCAMEF